MIMSQWHQQLEAILQEGVESARNRERTTFDEFTGPRHRDIVLYGAGNLGRKVARGLRAHDVEVLAFADNNPSLAGKDIDDIPVFAPAEAVEKFGNKCVFVVCVWHPTRDAGVAQIVEHLTALGAERATGFPWLFWKYPETFLPYYLWDLPSKLLSERDAICRAWSLLEEDGSREQFVAQLKFRSTADFSILPEPELDPQYFPSDLFRPREDECFIDCGAYNGDTVRDFLGWSGNRFRRIVAFELDPLNHAALKASIAEDAALKGRAVARLSAIGDRIGKVRLVPTGQGSSVVSSDGDAEVDCTTLDEALAHETPTYIKMDVEGWEEAALLGGREIIWRHKPLLAVCLYHRQADLWNLPLLMHELEPESRINLRMYWRDGFDLVGFAVPVDRGAMAQQPRFV